MPLGAVELSISGLQSGNSGGSSGLRQPSIINRRNATTNAQSQKRSIATSSTLVNSLPLLLWTSIWSSGCMSTTVSNSRAMMLRRSASSSKTSNNPHRVVMPLILHQSCIIWSSCKLHHRQVLSSRGLNPPDQPTIVGLQFKPNPRYSN